MISEQDVQAYKRDGVIVVPDVLGTDTLAELRSVIAELVAGSAKTLEHTDIYDLEPGHTAETPRVRRIKTPHKVHALFDQIVRSAAVLDILTQLIGPGLRLHGSKLNMKSAQYGSPVEWHQDWAFYPHTNDDVLAIGVLLDDCDLSNGPMLVTPGTHNREVWNHHGRCTDLP
jgi:ectoine hydroxylase-related dioxygenase (phytanoyl-CoA dioxygenase family)